MSVQSTTQNAQAYVTKKLATAQGWGSNQWTAIVIWLVGAWLTSVLIGQLGIAEPINYVFGLAFQWILTKAEGPIWRKQGFPIMGVGALFVDTLVNAAGAWIPMQNLGQTDFWSMINDLLRDRTVANPQPIEPTLLTLFVLSVGLGLFTAGAAEYFWNLPS